MELLHPAMWHDHDIDFARWLHPAMWHVALESWQWLHQRQHPVMWHVALGWHAIEFARWQHPAMWQVALRWYAMEFVQTSAILEFYIWFLILTISPQSTSHSAPVCKILSKSDHLSNKMTSCRFSRWRISAILDFRGPIMGSLKRRCTTSYRSSIDTIALNCLVFDKIAFICILAIDRQTDRQTDTGKQMDSIDALSRSRCHEWRLNNQHE